MNRYLFLNGAVVGTGLQPKLSRSYRAFMNYMLDRSPRGILKQEQRQVVIDSSDLRISYSWGSNTGKYTISNRSLFPLDFTGKYGRCFIPTHRSFISSDEFEGYFDLAQRMTGQRKLVTFGGAKTPEFIGNLERAGSQVGKLEIIGRDN